MKQLVQSDVLNTKLNSDAMSKLTIVDTMLEELKAEFDNPLL